MIKAVHKKKNYFNHASYPKSLNWAKWLSRTGKPGSPTFSWGGIHVSATIAPIIEECDIPCELMVILTPSSYVSLGKYMFEFCGIQNSPIKWVDIKRPITVTTCVKAAGNLFPV